MALVLHVFKKSYPSSVKGLGDWANVPLLAFTASLLYGLQGNLHLLISMALPNMLVVSACALQMRGTYRHFGHQLNNAWLGASLVACAALILWWNGKDDFYVHRLVFIAGITGVMFAAQFKVLWRHRSGSFGAQFMLVTLAVLCAVMLLRILTAIADAPPAGIFVPTLMQTVYLSSFSFGVLVLSIGGILLASEQLRNELTKLLQYDALTGAFTMRAAMEYGNDQLAHSLRQKTDFSVLFLDLDHFKSINDTYGHQVGDLVLSDFVSRAKKILRRPSVIGRYGGEEFIVFLPDTNREQALLVAQRLLVDHSTDLRLPRHTVSIGLASVDHQRQDSLDSLIGRADAALYRAKERGRNRIETEETKP